MRVLGPFIPSDQGITGEIKKRCDAIRLAWRQGGTFWSSKNSFAVKRMMFIAFVFGAGLSGLTAMVLSPCHTATLDAVIGKYLRTLARGKMSWTRADGTVRCYSTAR
eukprot:4588821-Pyramimonas_sp.AAC.1